MCRLFGFRSVINSQVHSSLVHADNALISQSLDHPDGWGVAYYRENTPHLIKSTDRAVDDQIFHMISGVVSSQTVIAHIRKATQGKLSILNSHPFQYGKWVFAHNGNLKDFDCYKNELMKYIDEDLRRFVLGTTDSEVIFYLLISLIKKKHKLTNTTPSFQTLKESTQELCDIICKFTGPLYGGLESNPAESHLTFILTTGKTMIAFNGGLQLKYSTYKTKCSESETCAFYGENCVNPSDKGHQIKHLLFSSEELQGENIWLRMKNGEMIGVDEEMLLHQSQLEVEFLKQPS